MPPPDDAAIRPARGPSLLVGGVATAANVAVQASAQLAVIVLAARRISAADLGVYVAGVTVVMFVVAVESAISLAVVPVAARIAGGGSSAAADDAAVASLLRLQRLLLRIGVGVVALGLVVAAATYATVANPVGRSVLAGQLAAAAAVYLVSAVVRGTVQGYERYAFFSAGNMAGQLCNVVIAVALVGRYGLAALGLGQLVAALVSRGMLFLDVRRRLRARAPAPTDAPPRPWLPTVGPLLLTVAGGQFVAAVSALTIGFVVDADAAGVFRVSAQLSAQLMALVYQLADMLLPRLSRQVDAPSAQPLERRLARETGLCAAAALALLCVHRDAALRLVLGAEPVDGATVVLVASLAWLVNVPAHVAVLRLVALDAFRLLWPVLVAETVLACALLVALVPRAGIVGGAVAVAAASSLSNAVALPWRCRSALPVARFLQYARSAALGIAEGVGAAALGWLAVGRVGSEPVALVLHALVTVAGVGVVLALRRGRRAPAVAPVTG